MNLVLITMDSREDLVKDFERDEELGLSEDVPLLAEEPIIEEKIDDDGGKDVVQFSSSTYYGQELDVLVVDVIRLGTMKGRMAVSYRTDDRSAKAFDQYKPVAGQVVFEDGEHTKTIEIELYDDETWSVVHDFVIRLSHPQNCQLGLFGSLARVKILNLEAFPSDEFKEDVKKGLVGIKGIDDWFLFWEFCKLVYWHMGMTWQASMVLILDQLSSVFLFITLWVGVYIVDVIFDRGHSSREHLLVPDRYQTAVLIAFWYVLPHLGLFMWEACKVYMDIQGETRKFLQVGLMRTYLDYNVDSREMVTVADVSVAMTSSADQIANSYVAGLAIVGIAGRIVAVELFIIWFQPEVLAIQSVLLMVAILIFLTFCRVGYAQHAQERVEARLTLMETLCEEACGKYRLFCDYAKRSLMAEMFTKSCEEYNLEKIPDTFIHLSTQYSTKFVSGIFIANYIVQRTPAVLQGTLSLGIFLATITIFCTYLADAITELNNQLMVIVDAFVPLKEFVLFLNLPLDLPARLKAQHERVNHTKDLRRSLQYSSKEADAFQTDRIPIVITNLAFQYPSGKCIFKNVNISIPQGHLIAVTGEHKSGKATFVQLLANILTPTGGNIFVPSHLRMLHVSREPMFVNATMLHNLSLGLPPGQFDMQRIKTILKLLDMPDVLDIVESELKTEGDSAGTTTGFMEDEIRFMGSTDTPWAQLMTQSQKIKLHIARALVANPEIIVFERTLEGLNEDAASKVFDVIHKHVKERGVGMAEASYNARRPCTVFFSTETAGHAAKADFTLQMDPQSSSVTQSNQQSRLSALFKPKREGGDVNKIGCMG